MKTVQKGDILISEPFLNDPNFHRKVILIVEKDHSGTVGFILNHKLNMTLSDKLPYHFESDLYFGGPVSLDTLHFVVNSNIHVSNSVQVLPDVSYGGNFYDLADMVKNKIIHEEQVKLFIGYSGWDAGQLEYELSERVWAVGRASREVIFGDHSGDLWKKSMRNLGGIFALMANSPIDPKFN